jgi:cobalt-zinc-cadmium efflux system membrane fusion protein
MKRLLSLLPFAAFAALPLFAATDDSSSTNTVVLDATGVKNLRLATEVAAPNDFAETIFALGRLDVYPGNRAVISSRIAGHADRVLIKHDHSVEAGELAIVIQSRQVGDPPPSINLTAPISGLISTIHVVVGQPVSPDDILAEILDLSKVYAIARVPEQLAHHLQSGQRAQLTVTATGNQVYPAELEHLGALADPITGTVEAAFYVDNPDLILRPGMRVEFSVEVSRRPDVISVPRSALQGTPANRFVYVKDFDIPNAFIKTPVVVGQSNDQRAEIISGLFPFDEVVTRGAYSLAFAGAGTLSLKEALDAAHGHEHNADGSEMTPGSKPAESAHAHDDDALGHATSSFWKIVSGVLFVALLAVSFFKSRQA